MVISSPHVTVGIRHDALTGSNVNLTLSWTRSEKQINYYLHKMLFDGSKARANLTGSRQNRKTWVFVLALQQTKRFCPLSSLIKRL